jgi:hypothetical protein
MGRLIAFILGGAAIVFYGAYLLPEGDFRNNVVGLWAKPAADHPAIQELLDKILQVGPGVIAGVALILFAIRGRED